jgi:hypothetical protein
VLSRLEESAASPWDARAAERPMQREWSGDDLFLLRAVYFSFARFSVATHGMSATFWTDVYLRPIVNSIRRWRGCV